MPEIWNIGGTMLYDVHDRHLCKGRGCSVHNPTDLHLGHMPLYWRDDRHFFERICIHGTGHPQLDDYAFQLTRGRDIASHGCCGCCAAPSAPEPKMPVHNTFTPGW